MLCGQCSEENADITIDVLSKISSGMGICRFSYEITPNEQAITYDQSSWTPKSEEAAVSGEIFEPFNSRTTKPTESTSKKKRVKHYIKKCKNALRSTSLEKDVQTSSFTCKLPRASTELNLELKTSEISEIEDVFYDALVEGDGELKLELASSVLVKEMGIGEDTNKDFDKCLSFQTQISVTNDIINDEKEKVDVDTKKKIKSNETLKSGGRECLNKKHSPKTSHFLKKYQDTFEDSRDNLKHVGDHNFTDKEYSSNILVKNDVELLVNRYFGHIYNNYDRSKKCLIREARNTLVCEYQGCLKRFEEEFCIPASKLLMHIKNEYSNNTATPTGWPLCLGQSGIIIQIGPLDLCNLRNGDCYLCVQTRSKPGLEVALIWKLNNKLHCHTVAEFCNPLHLTNAIMCSSVRTVADIDISYEDDLQSSALPELLQNLLVSVEHAIKRVPLDDLTFPCPQCQQYIPLEHQDNESASCSCQCLCPLSESHASKNDSAIQTNPMLEFVGSIPHIDSDEDFDDRDSIASGTLNKKLEIAKPRSISELPDKLLMSGINLPGTTDKEGRPIILCYAECISRTALNKYEIAKLLQYYASIPKPETKRNGFTILLVADNEADGKILELLDKSVCLIINNLKVSRFIIWTPGKKAIDREKILASQAQAIFITDESNLEKYITKNQAPASCHGTCTHDQLEWVEFFKQLEPFLVDCQTAGKHLLSTLSYLRNEEIPQQVTRRFLNHQCRQITKALSFETVQKLKREGNKTFENLSERSQWISGSQDVKRGVKCANDSFSAVKEVTKRLEQLKFDRMERLKELARFKMLQEEIEELSDWIKSSGKESLSRLVLLLHSATDSAGVKEIANSFDEFFFKAWKQIDKSNDLIEEWKNLKKVGEEKIKNLAFVLILSTKDFKEELEATRERIEDSSRCFLLLESCQHIFEEHSKEQEDFLKLAENTQNKKLMEICKEAKQLGQPPDKSSFQQNGSLFQNDMCIYKPQGVQLRRKSVSSLAFIYHCSHHAAGEMCNCRESDAENSVSFKLKKKYIQSLQNCACQNGGKESIEGKNCGILTGIKELRESSENLLDKSDFVDNDHRCDSGISTADNSITEENSNSFSFSKRTLQRTCSCQYYKEGFSTTSSSTESSQDAYDRQHDNCLEDCNDAFHHKSHVTDDLEDENYGTEQGVPSLSANNHLCCRASIQDLPLDSLYSNMDLKTQKTLNYIINEMIDTERDYVKSLDYVIINYIPELQREDIPQALRGHRNTVFGNIEKIYDFHRHQFLRELEDCENNPLQVGQIFLKYDGQFYLYALYNKNKPKSDSLMSEYGSVFFKAKQLELEDKMDLASYLLKPVQRMGKYALLLQQMIKACAKTVLSSLERVVQEIEDLKQAEEMVRFQLRHGNDLLAMDSIRECDVNLKEQGRLLRQNEFLVWEGRNGKKSLRQVFLFEELILFSKARRLPDRKNLDLYIYKNSIKMTDIGLTARISESATKFEIWFRKRKPNDTFTLQSMSEEVKKAWVEELSQLLWRQALRNRAVRMAEMSSMGIGNKPCLDIRPSADQISDRSISFAQLSKTAPRFRNSIASSLTDTCRNVKRPHSVISMSSMSSGSTSSAGSMRSCSTSLSQRDQHSFESSCEASNSFQRSITLHSQCSVESGIITDMSVTSDDILDQTQNITS